MYAFLGQELCVWVMKDTNFTGIAFILKLKQQVPGAVLNFTPFAESKVKKLSQYQHVSYKFSNKCKES